MFKALNKTKEWLLDILLPKFCVGCGKEGLYICKGCEVFLSEVENVQIKSEARNPKHETNSNNQTDNLGFRISDLEFPPKAVFSVWEYEGLMEKLIHKIKFDGCYHIIDELMEKAVQKILEFGFWNLDFPSDTVITFVPMRKKWERKRGFNQSELIARKLGQLLGFAEQPLLVKVRDNRSQVGLGPREREENVKGVFQIKFEARNSKHETNSNNQTDNLGFRISYLEFPPKAVLLVDDVYTTGATMRECAKVLRKAGVKNVWGFTIARKISF